MRTIDTNEYISVLRELTESGKEVSLCISGNSMMPFLIHQRDYICFKKPSGDLQKGDMVFYQRENGRFVMHRICRVKPEGFYIVGDAQVEIEGPLKREQIFGIVTSVKRKGKWIKPGDFCWDFFANIWLKLIPVRPILIKIYGIVSQFK